jgi:hypothetical protein
MCASAVIGTFVVAGGGGGVEKRVVMERNGKWYLSHWDVCVRERGGGGGGERGVCVCVSETEIK